MEEKVIAGGILAKGQMKISGAGKYLFAYRSDDMITGYIICDYESELVGG